MITSEQLHTFKPSHVACHVSQYVDKSTSSIIFSAYPAILLGLHE